MYAFLIDNTHELPECPVYYCVMAADIKRVPLAECYDDMGNRIGADAGDIMADAITVINGYHLQSFTVWQSAGHPTHQLINRPETVAILRRAIIEKLFVEMRDKVEVFRWNAYLIELVPGSWYRARIQYIGE